MPSAVVASNRYLSRMGRQVLVVDDDADTRELLAVLLSARGFSVQVAAEGQEGLRLAEQSRPAVIFLDLVMPGMDGETMRRELLRRPRLRTVPVVCISGSDDAEDVARELAFAACMPKPIDCRRLVDVAERYCRSTVRRRVRASTVGHLTVTSNTAVGGLMPQPFRDRRVSE